MAQKIDNGNVLGRYGDNFDTHPDWRHDIFVQAQSLMPDVGDIKSGKAEKFVKRAYEQNYWHTEDRLAAEQEKFVEDDPINNTPDLGDLNYRRMEYPIQKKPNGKGAEEDREEAEKREVLDKDEVLDLLKNRYSICSTASAWGNEPITQEDYKDQIKLR